MISRIFPFFGKKTEPKRKDPVVKAEFAVHRFGGKQSNSEAVADVGRLLAKRFPKLKPHDFGTSVQGPLSKIEKSIEDIGEDSAAKGLREQVEVKIDFKPGRKAA